MPDNDNLLEIKDLQVEFLVYKSVIKALQGVNLAMRRGETLGVVGESGCGKSVTASAVMQLIPCPPGRIVSGTIRFEGQDILAKSENEMRALRGSAISMIFQDPMTALNPVFTVGDQVGTVIGRHQKVGRREGTARAMEMFTRVGMSDPATVLKKYPHELSGGMCQRVMIAMALSCRPSLLIADEPTTALDVTVQAEILQLMDNLKQEIDTAIMLITHDLGVVAKMCAQIAVMYAGRVVEYGTRRDIFKNPGHPYTRGLLQSTPRIGAQQDRLATIKGSVPALSHLPPGCLFNPRCDRAQPECRQTIPAMEETEKGHFVACHY